MPLHLHPWKKHREMQRKPLLIQKERFKNGLRNNNNKKCV